MRKLIFVLMCSVLFSSFFITVQAKETPTPTPKTTATPAPTVTPKSKVKLELISSVSIKLRKEPGTVNAQVAAKIVNGYILKSGKIFSYNGVVGERTLAKGFIVGTLPITDKNGKKVIIKSVGSGVCRLSVGLATAAKRASLKQVEIKAHEFTPYYFYTNKGLVDATVYWDSKIDNKFQNIKDYDIKIICSVDTKSVLRVSFYKIIYPK